MAQALPLLSRHPDEIIASRGDRPVTCGEFLAQAMSLAESLPDRPLAANLCEDRYRFMLAFIAVVVRGQANLLLPSRRQAAITEVLDGIADHYILHDGEFSSGDGDESGVPTVDVRRIDDAPEPIDIPMPIIPADQLAAIVFTSGSTGESVPVRKSWRTLVVGTAINRRYALSGIDGPIGIVATVPPWHMYGLEYSILAPLFCNVRTYAGNTLFPGDILSGLKRMPVKRVLVATPVHLRALVRSNLAFPPVARVLCATAPLSQELASQAADVLKSDVRELYGCTEAGCLAYRNPIATTEWTLFDEFSADCSGDHVSVAADHLSEPFTLSDDLRFGENARFVLQGRSTDLVKIGGKRGSLAELTNRLLMIDGVEDAIVFSPDPNPDGDGNEARLTALVVCPGRDVADIRNELARVVDPVFLPRPLRQVDALPRNRTGKLSRSDLQRMINNPGC